MDTPDLQLGQALAILIFEHHNGSFDGMKKLSKGEKTYVDSLKEVFSEISQAHSKMAILEKIPNECCPGERPFLFSNERYFIASLVDAALSEAAEQDCCLSLYSHLNNCYWCFDIFQEVMRDFAQSMDQLNGLD